MTHDRSQLSRRQGRIKVMIQANILYEYECVYEEAADPIHPK